MQKTIAREKKNRRQRLILFKLSDL